MNNPVIRPAEADEADALSELAMRSKAYWGYSNEFMEACADELRVDATQLDENNYACFVAARDRTVLGYYALVQESASHFELDALFVEPEHIGRGIGRILVEHAVQRVADAGGKVLTIQGDPNAAAFYLAVGGREAGSRESDSIPGRYLPVFEIDIAER